MAQIQFKDVQKSYGKVKVIESFNLDVDDGEMIVIVGTSGCGKSTLLRMLAGLETISAGDISIDEKRVNNIEPDKRNIAMVFQNYALYPHMSVFNNMAYGLKIAKMAKPDIEQRVVKAAKMLQLDHLLERKPNQLSGGQRQRVAMGRAIVRQPAVFLFDEPLSNLDAKLRVEMRIQIKELQRELGVTSLYVTHDQVEAMTLADRVVLMNNGVAEQIGTPLQLYNQPETQFVAEFIGSPPMNFIASNDLDENNCDKDIYQLVKNNDYSIGFRPENIQLDDHTDSGNSDSDSDSDSDSGNENGIHLVVKKKFVEALGAEVLVYFNTDNNRQIIAKASNQFDWKDDQKNFKLFIPKSAIHIFDESGKRVNKL